MHEPREVYSEVRGDPPDLMIYLDDLSWRPAGTIGGWNTLYLPEYDRGPDDAEHDWNASSRYMTRTEQLREGYAEKSRFKQSSGSYQI